MRNLIQGAVLVTTLGIFLFAGLGCEAAGREKPVSRLGKDSEAVKYEALKSAYKKLQLGVDKSELERKKLLERVKYYQGREQARTILSGEIDSIIEDLLKYGGTRQGERIALEDQFFFKPGSADLTEQGKTYLLNIAHELSKIDYLVRIEGHTDPTPVQNPATRRKFDDNWGLSAGRAASVVRFLQERGRIPGERLIGVFYGPYKPVADNSKEGNKLNRRVEIRLVPPYSEQDMKVDLVEQPGEVPAPAAGDGSGFRSRNSFLDGGRAAPAPAVRPAPAQPGTRVEGIVPTAPQPVRPAQPVPVAPEVIEDDDDGEGAPVIIK